MGRLINTELNQFIVIIQFKNGSVINKQNINVIVKEKNIFII